MEEVEVTSLSSRGQVVIPQHIREALHLNEGTKFVVIGEEDTIILKKIGLPDFKGFEKLLKKTQSWAKKKGLKPEHLEEARKNV